MKKKNIAIIVGMWIAGAIAIAFVFWWATATSSPSTSTLISVNIGIGISSLLSIFSIGIWLADRIERYADRMERRMEKAGDKISERMVKNTEKLSEVSEILARIEVLLREGGK